MLEFLRRWMQRLCLAIKHTVLEYAHPPPDAITVFPGRRDGVDHALVHFMLRTVLVPNLTVVHRHTEDPDEEQSGVWVHDEACGDVEARGSFAVCRYLSRLWRLNPTAPVSALILDAALERLARFTAVLDSEATPTVVGEHLACLLYDMELELRDETAYIGGMHSASVCDVMYLASVRFALDRLDTTLNAACDETSHPRVHAWWRVQHQNDDISLDEGGTEDETTE